MGGVQGGGDPPSSYSSYSSYFSCTSFQHYPPETSSQNASLHPFDPCKEHHLHLVCCTCRVHTTVPHFCASVYCSCSCAGFLRWTARTCMGGGGGGHRISDSLHGGGGVLGARGGGGAKAVKREREARARRGQQRGQGGGEEGGGVREGGEDGERRIQGGLGGRVGRRRAEGGDAGEHGSSFQRPMPRWGGPGGGGGQQRGGAHARHTLCLPGPRTDTHRAVYKKEKRKGKVWALSHKNFKSRHLRLTINTRRVLGSGHISVLSGHPPGRPQCSQPAPTSTGMYL